MMQVMMFAWPTYDHQFDIEEKYLGLMGWAGWLLTLPVIFYSATPIFKNAFHSVVHFSKIKSLHMDVPIAIAISLSWLVGTGHLIFQLGATYFDSITMFVALLLLARFIELKARHHTQNTVEALAMQLPETCNLIREQSDGLITVEKLPIRVITPGDILQIFPGEIIPVDGVIVKQSVFVSEAILTGESKAIEKKVGEEVFAGSFNLESTLYCKVLTLGSDTKLGAIAKLLQETLNQKPKYSSISEKWASYFVLALLIIATLTGIVWSLMGQNQAWERALAVLVVTCPCAISLAIPLALAASHGLLAKLGLAVVSSDVIEKLNTVDTIFIDKTGTVTTGNLNVEKILIFDSEWTEREILLIANVLEKDQNHPIAQAIRLKAKSCDLMEINIQSYGLDKPNIYQIGKGVTCGSWQIGAPNWLKSTTSNPELIQESLKQILPGATPIFLTYQNKIDSHFLFKRHLKS
jgi:Cu2+-exporting ATPase